MTSDSELIKAALAQRFARAGMPNCPERAWQIDATVTSRKVSLRVRSHRLAYAALFVAVAAIGGIGAQAANAVRESYEHVMAPVFASDEPLKPLIHAADRLTMAQAQRRMPFTIVDPAGLPDHTRFMYAHVLSEASAARVALNYETHYGTKYYRVSIEESTAVSEPPVAHFNVLFLGHTIDWTLPKIRWKHGSVTMDLFDWQLPHEMNDRIVRANTR
jgi:hypothetical protein